MERTNSMNTEMVDITLKHWFKRMRKKRKEEIREISCWIRPHSKDTCNRTWVTMLVLFIIPNSRMTSDNLGIQ